MTTAPAAPPVTPAAPLDESALLERLVKAFERVGEKSKPSNPFYGDLVGMKHDVPGGGPIEVGYSHGPGGNLTFPGVDPSVFHVMVGNRGLLGQLPATPSIDTTPVFEVITGVTDESGDEPEDVCDDAPVAGLMKTALLTSVFGRYERATAQIEINRLGQRYNRADPLDLRMIGSPIAETGVFSQGPGDPRVPQDVLRNEVSRKFWELGVAFNRLLRRQLWSGSPANNLAGGGYKELTGVDVLVNTGHRDAQTGVAVPSLDSDVRDFNYADVTDNGALLVEVLASMYHIAKDNAERMGVMPVRWVWAMHPETFWEISDIWACAFLTYRCNLEGIDGARVNIDARDQVRARDEMRNGKFLLLDGDRIEVITDDAIPQQSSATDANVPEAAFASTVYLLPMSILAGMAVTYLEYFDYRNPSITDALAGSNMALGRVDGAFITVPKQRNFCLQWQSKIEPRLIMRTPWLASRLDNVVSSPLKRTRSEFPDDPYHLDGGVTTRSGPSVGFSIWEPAD
jgi:hypothetical protein